MCKGCNSCKGRVFHAGGEECPIYSCCVTEHGFSDCLECGDIPCWIWKKTRDPKFTDEELDKNIAEQMETLRNNRS